ncbi:hypothetical protein [Pseudoduganella violacea]|uniref:Uncharacterized protein n=1 Tax=Pseudoduganella violacea TaxID=1715466 RepID=A0A7W5BEN8_9BURK|nr:hypothetical protein [Pseudoduganella violacea]MBB3121578.1 hypothetical protein [Pseudoduganella violacea]
MFQPTIANGAPLQAVAWKVIRNCPYGWLHPFAYSLQLEAGIGDCYGNFSPRLAAREGDAFAVLPTAAGRCFSRCGAQAADGIVVRNGMARGALYACLFNDGRLLARSSGLALRQGVSFCIPAVLRIGVGGDVREGQLLDAETMAGASCELRLAGLRSADLIMTGGDEAGAVPAGFHLENLVYA